MQHVAQELDLVEDERIDILILKCHILSAASAVRCASHHQFVFFLFVLQS